MNLPINDIRYGLRMILKAPAVRVSSSHFADRLYVGQKIKAPCLVSFSSVSGS